LTMSFGLVGTVQALSIQAIAVRNPKTFLGEGVGGERREENETIFRSGILTDFSSLSDTCNSLYFFDFAATLCIRVKNGSLI
jgi:hypothetical protein